MGKALRTSPAPVGGGAMSALPVPFVALLIGLLPGREERARLLGGVSRCAERAR